MSIPSPAFLRLRNHLSDAIFSDFDHPVSRAVKFKIDVAHDLIVDSDRSLRQRAVSRRTSRRVPPSRACSPLLRPVAPLQPVFRQLRLARPRRRLVADAPPRGQV